MATLDALIIGSGVGGLTCAAFLARAGLRVLVLEKHLRVGGYAHSFRRRAYEFSSGIHSVPMGRGGIVDTILERLGIREQVPTVELPTMFSAHMPGSTFTIPSRTEDIREYFFGRFPAAREALQGFFDDAQRFYRTVEAAGFDFEEGFVEHNREFVQKYHNRPYADYLDSITRDPALRATLHAMWPYAGMPPAKAATVFCVMMFAMHYLEGSHYVRGGFSRLAEELAGVVRACGGEVRTGTAVSGLVVEGEQVRAVRCTDGSEYEAGLVVSNVAPLALHTQLLPEHSRSRRWVRRARNLNPSMSVVGVYLGVSPDILAQIPSCVTLIYGSEDHEDAFRRARTDPVNADHVIVLRPAEESTHPTLLLMRFAAQRASANWREDKLRAAENMLVQAEQCIPGIRGAIQVMETGSPDTYQRYTGNTEGAIYGYENTCSLYGEARMPTRTHLRNLFQTGHWQRPGSGVWNVMLNGSVVSRAILDGPVAHR